MSELHVIEATCIRRQLSMLDWLESGCLSKAIHFVDLYQMVIADEAFGSKAGSPKAFPVDEHMILYRSFASNCIRGIGQLLS